MQTGRNYPYGGDASAHTEGGMKEQAMQKAQNAKEQVRELANAGRETVAEQIESVARALHSAGDQLKGDEKSSQAGYYTDLIGERADRVARYLRERDASDLVNEVEDFARSNTLLFIGGCAAVGLVIGRFLKASTPSLGETPDTMISPIPEETGGIYGRGGGMQPSYGYGSPAQTEFGHLGESPSVRRSPEPEVAVVTRTTVATPDVTRRGGNGSSGQGG